MSESIIQTTEISGIRPYADIMRGWMTKHFGSQRHVAKTLADYVSIPGYRAVSARTTEGWKSGSSNAQVDDLLTLCAECDDLTELLVAEIARRKALKNSK